MTQVTEGATITSFSYDGDGGRVQKIVTPSSLQGATVSSQSLRGSEAAEAISTTYIGSLFEIQVKGQGSKVEVKHIFAGSQRVCSVTKDEGRGITDASYYHPDHLGSTSIVTDASGNQVERYEYTPYGTTAVQELVSRPSSLIHHKFTGKELDSTGLYYFGARYYDPEIGRFITPDTIVQAPYDPQSLNRYSYCRNNPINYIDPTGHFFWFIAAIIIGAVMGGASAAINGGNIGMGILMGALGGAMVAAGAVGASALWGPAWAFVGASVGGAASGAANAAVFGGNIGISALTGAIGAGIGAGLGYGIGQAAGPFWGAVAGGLAGGVAGGGVGAALNGGDFWQGAGMGAAYGVAGAMAGYGAAKAFGPKTNQSSQNKAPRQLTVDKKPANIVKRTNPNLKPGMIRRFVSESEYVEILDKGYVSSTNKEGTFWTPNNIISPEEAQTFLQLSGPSRHYAVDVPAENFNYAYQQTTVRGVGGGPITEAITEYGVRIAVRGGRVVDFRTMTETTFVYGDNN